MFLYIYIFFRISVRIYFKYGLGNIKIYTKIYNNKKNYL